MKMVKKKLVICVLLIYLVSIFPNISLANGLAVSETYDDGVTPLVNDNYVAWKNDLESNSTRLSSSVASLVSVASDIESTTTEKIMSNDYIEFAVENEGGDNGRFTIGTVNGNPSTNEDDFKKMLYGHPYPWSSYTTVHLDGSNHVFNPTTQFPTSDLSDLSNLSEFTVNNVSIKQQISIVRNSSTRRSDIVEIRYIVQNNDNVGHDAGLRVLMDTMLGRNDAAPFRIPGIGAVTKELELTGSEIPEYWQAFDSLTNPTVVSQGTLLRTLENKPDKVQFTNWSRAYYTPWDYNVNPDYNNGDSAVSIYWDTKPLAPGEAREYVTYYGLSELVQDLRPPLALSITGANIIEATEEGYNPNPFTVTAYIMNTGNGDANNVTAKLNLPEGLRLVSEQDPEISVGNVAPLTQEKQVSWKVEIDPFNEFRNLTYSVTVNAENTESKTISRDITIPPSIELSPITNVQVTPTTNAVSIGWNVPSEVNGSVTVYDDNGYYEKVDYGNVLLASASTTTVRSNTKSATFNNLREDNTYDFEITANKSGRTYYYMNSFKTKKNNVVIIVPGMAATELSIDHVESGQTTSTLHKVWAPRGVTTLQHDMSQLECMPNGSPWRTLIVGQPMDEYYGDLYRTLIAQGFDVYYFGYDWRDGNTNTAANLEERINKIMSDRKIDKVNIVAHSMGGLVASEYIGFGNANKVNKLVTIGTPYLGAPKATFVYETGKFLEWYQNIAVAKYLKDLVPNIESVYQLMPTPNYFQFNNTYYVEKFVDNPWPQSNTKTNIKNFEDTTKLLKSRNWANGSLYDRSISFHESLDLLNTLKSVDSYFIIGDQQTTIGKLQEAYEIKNGKQVFSSCDDIKNINGDGTVPVISANIGGKTEFIHPNHTYYIDDTHSELPNNPSVINQVSNILNGNTNLVKDMRRQPKNTWTLKLKIECPVDVHVYDEHGSHLGYFSNGELEESIPGSSYYLLGDKKIALLRDGNYNVKMFGTDQGEMTYTIQRVNEADEVEQTVRFEDVEISENAVITSNTNLAGEISLSLDKNADGIVDEIIKPTVVLGKDASQDTEPPTVGVEVYGDVGNDDWYTSDVTVTVNAEDAKSGVHRINYELDQSGINTYEGPIKLVNEGIHNIYMGAVDNNGNESETILGSIKIDKSAPQIFIDFKSDEPIALGSILDLNYYAVDTVSQIKSLNISLNDKPLLSGLPIIVDKPGQNIITIVAEDYAGNKQIKTVNFSAFIPATINVFPEEIDIKKGNNKRVFLASIELPTGYDVKEIDLKSIIVNGEFDPVLIGNKNIDFDFDKDLGDNNKLNRFKNLAGSTSKIEKEIKEQGDCIIDIDGDGLQEMLIVFVIPDIQILVSENKLSFRFEGQWKDGLFKGEQVVNVVNKSKEKQ